MASAEQLNHAKAFLRKAEEYLASAEANLVAEPTAAAGDAIHAGISAKDAIVTSLTGATRKAKDSLPESSGWAAETTASSRPARHLLDAAAAGLAWPRTRTSSRPP